jgi:hypothetical protein
MLLGKRRAAYGGDCTHQKVGTTCVGKDRGTYPRTTLCRHLRRNSSLPLILQRLQLRTLALSRVAGGKQI